MSVMQLPMTHINAMVNCAMIYAKENGGLLRWATRGREPDRLIVDDKDAARRLGQHLADVNFASVDADTLPGEPPLRQEVYTYEPMLGKPHPVDVMALVSRYEYQCVRASEWKESAAYSFCQVLIRQAISRLPGVRESKYHVFRGNSFM